MQEVALDLAELEPKLKWVQNDKMKWKAALNALETKKKTKIDRPKALDWKPFDVVEQPDTWFQKQAGARAVAYKKRLMVHM